MPVLTIPAPVGGINLQSTGDPKFATDLREWIPRAGYCEMRHPFTAVSTAVTPKGIHGWVGESGTSKVIISQSTKISHVASNGTVTDLKAGLTASTFWYHTMFQDRLILVNGTDTGQVYDGTSIADLVTTGAVATTLWGCHTFKGRVYYWKQNDQSFWYAAAGSYQGALTEFPLNTVTSRGGYLMAMATITNDGGEGADDLAAFIMSTGEVIVYQGDDPGAAKSWQMIGRFSIGKPLSQRGVRQVGAAVFVMTTDGIVNLPLALSDGRLTSRAKVSAPLDEAYRVIANTATVSQGPMSASYLPSESLFIAHCPFGTATTMFVMETNTGAWTTWTPCQFLAIGAYVDASICSGVVDDVLYLGGPSALMKYDTTAVVDGEFGGLSAFGYLVGFAKQNYFKLSNGRTGLITTASPRTNYDNLSYLNCRVVGDGKISTYDYSGTPGLQWWTADTTTLAASLRAITTPTFGVATNAAAENFTFYMALSQKHATPIRWYETRLGYKLGGSR